MSLDTDANMLEVCPSLHNSLLTCNSHISSHVCPCSMRVHCGHAAVNDCAWEFNNFATGVTKAAMKMGVLGWS